MSKKNSDEQEEKPEPRTLKELVKAGRVAQPTARQKIAARLPKPDARKMERLGQWTMTDLMAGGL